MQIRTLIIIVLSLLLLTACGRPTQAADQQLTLTGSTSVGPFAEQLAEHYMQEFPGREINVQSLGSTAGIQAATNGTVEIGMSSRQLEPEEAEQLETVEIARDALAVIVHPSNSITTLTQEQVQDIFAGRVHNWREVGGRNAPIVIVTREAGSGTYGAFEELVMQDELPTPKALRQGSNGAVRQIVAGHPDAIGYISLGIVDDTVKAIAIDGVQPTTAAVLDEQYNLVRPFLFVHRQAAPLSPPAQEFIDYVLSPEGQRISTLST